MDGINAYYSIEQLSAGLDAKKNLTRTSENVTESFYSLLKSKTDSIYSDEGLKFSKHAAERLSSRNIDLSDTQMQRLKDGVEKAGNKGIKESLVMVDNMAFIVNIPNNTVVTAVNDNNDMVFTNIDGAVIS
jgi:flagellar operon protein